MTFLLLRLTLHLQWVGARAELFVLSWAFTHLFKHAFLGGSRATAQRLPLIQILHLKDSSSALLLLLLLGESVDFFRGLNFLDLRVSRDWFVLDMLLLELMQEGRL
jgi:hypothetical protein